MKKNSLFFLKIIILGIVVPYFLVFGILYFCNQLGIYYGETIRFLALIFIAILFVLVIHLFKKNKKPL